MKRIKKKQKKLGNKNKYLVIRLVKRNNNYYDVVLSRKRAKPTSRLARFGYYNIFRNHRESFSLLALDFNRITKLLSSGVGLHSSFSKILIN